MSKEEADKLTSRVLELSDDKENIALYTKLTNDEMVFNTRLMNASEEAEERGSQEKALEIAKNFLKMGLTDEQIANGTGLSIEEIESLKK